MVRKLFTNRQTDIQTNRGENNTSSTSLSEVMIITVTPPGQNFCLNIKHLKESYLVGLSGLNLLTHGKLEIRIRKDLAPNHAKRKKNLL